MEIRSIGSEREIRSVSIGSGRSEEIGIWRRSEMRGSEVGVMMMEWRLRIRKRSVIERGEREIGRVKRRGIESVSVRGRLRRSGIGNEGRRMRMRVGRGKKLGRKRSVSVSVRRRGCGRERRNEIEKKRGRN